MDHTMSTDPVRRVPEPSGTTSMMFFSSFIARAVLTAIFSSICADAVVHSLRADPCTARCDQGKAEIDRPRP